MLRSSLVTVIAMVAVVTVAAVVIAYVASSHTDLPARVRRWVAPLDRIAVRLRARVVDTRWSDGDLVVPAVRRRPR